MNTKTAKDKAFDKYLQDLAVFTALVQMIPVIEDESTEARDVFLRVAKSSHDFFMYFWTTGIRDFSFEGYLKALGKGSVFVEDLQAGSRVRYVDGDFDKVIEVHHMLSDKEEIFFQDDERTWSKCFDEVPQFVKEVIS